MCGRYSLAITEGLVKKYGLKEIPSGLKSNYNASPGQKLPVIIGNGGSNIKIMVWGLIPFWSKDGKNGMINARSESITQKPTFKTAYQKRRCLIPATGFYEWQKTDDGKTPYYIYLKNAEYFSFAGIYDIWNDGSNSLYTYAIITTTPNSMMAKIHNRMPVILDKTQEESWISSSIVSPEPVFKPYPAELMDCYPVSKAVNNPAFNDSGLIKKITPDNL